MLIASKSGFMTRRLPYDAELEYLESTGTQWIDTGVVPGDDLRTLLTAAYTGSPIAKNSSIFGSVKTGESRYWINYDNHFEIGYGSYVSTNITVAPYEIFDADFNFVENGERKFRLKNIVTTKTGSPNTEISMSLFGRNTNGTRYPAKARLYNLKFIRNNVLVRDFIPVRKGTVGYLYDRVSRKLFGNAGTGDFVCGPDVVPVEYIQQTGTQYIDTLYPMADTRREVITVDWSGHSTTNREYMAGAASGSYLIELSANGYYGTAPTNLSSIQVSQKDRIRWDYTVGSKPSLYINDVFAINDTLVRVPTGNIMTGGVGSSGVNFPKMKIYGLDIFTNTDEQVRKMLPVRVGTDATSWEGAMIDTLTRRVYRNQGTGAFGYGNDLRYPIPAE